MSHFDRFYRRLLIAKIFSKGWGNPENLKRLFQFRRILSNRDLCHKLVDETYPVVIDKEYEAWGVHTIEGHFQSPFARYLAGIMPAEVETAYFQLVLPSEWRTTLRPVCINLAGTGDHNFWRRRTLCAKPLLKDHHIASLILENPYYGRRKPKLQRRSCLHNVTDLFVMGGALILECLVLLHWLNRHGYGPLGISGVSMGGHMASLAATNWPKPISLIPCLSWSTASCVFTEGVLSSSIPWNILEDQFLTDKSYEEELRHVFQSSSSKHPKAYMIGQEFAKTYPSTIENFNSLSPTNAFTHSSSSSGSNMSAPSLVISLDSPSASTTQVRCKDTSQGDPSLDSHYNASPCTDLRSGKRNNENRKLSSNSRRTVTSDCNLSEQVVDFMRGIMDEFTHLANFSVPVDPRCVIAVVAEKDAYIPREGVHPLDLLWPGCEVRCINLGHIGTFLFKQGVFRKAIHDSFTRQINLHY